MLIVKGIVGGLFQLALFGAFLLVPAGRFVPFFAGLALWLESYAALIAVSVVVAVLVARILVEEKTLHATLPGYSEYKKKVPYRLVPFVW